MTICLLPRIKVDRQLKYYQVYLFVDKKTVKNQTIVGLKFKPLKLPEVSKSSWEILFYTTH